MENDRTTRTATARPLGSFEVGGRSGWGRLTDRFGPSLMQTPENDGPPGSQSPVSASDSSNRSVDRVLWVTAGGGVAFVAAWFLYSIF